MLRLFFPSRKHATVRHSSVVPWTMQWDPLVQHCPRHGGILEDFWAIAAIPFATDFQAISSGYVGYVWYGRRNYQYILNSSIHWIHCEYIFKLIQASQTSCLWDFWRLQAQLAGRPNTGPLGKAGPWEDLVNFGKRNRVMPYRGNGNVRGSRHTVYDSDMIKTQVVLMFESCSNLVQIALGGQSLDRLSHSLRGIF